jgi:hypothetical protein
VMDREFEPDPLERERHERGYERYQMLYRQLVPFNAT